MYLSKRKTTHIRGSFLIELLVAFAIISIAMTVIVDSFLTSQRTYRSTVEQAEVTRIMSRVLEDMTIEARVSNQFQCGGNPAPCTATLFQMNYIEGLNGATGAETITYRLDGTKIQKSTDGGTTYIDMTPPQVEVTRFHIAAVRGVSPDLAQTRVRVNIHARETANHDNEIDLQTSFTSRIY